MCSPAPRLIPTAEEAEFNQMDLNLTKRQSEIFEFIKGQLDKTGYPPTVREIGSALGLHSPSTVHAHLAKLESPRRPAPRSRPSRGRSRSSSTGPSG